MARVKQRSNISEIGKPVPTRKKQFTSDCYIEWQIAYDSLEMENSLSKISFNRTKLSDGTTQLKYLYELSDMLCSAIKLNLLDKRVLSELISFAERVGENDYIELSCPPQRSFKEKSQFEQLTFSIYNQELPIFVHQFHRYFIELLVQPKQRAVGNQAMLFLSIPVTELLEWQSLDGRIAESKEEGTFVIDKVNSAILLSLMKCFILSSEQHEIDILSIIRSIQSKVK